MAFAQAARLLKKAGKPISWVSELATGMPLKEAVRDPFIGFPAFVGGGAFGYELGSDFVDNMNEDPLGEGQEKYAAMLDRDRQMDTYRREAEYDRVRQDMMASLQQLASQNPQLYTEVMAGRKLPRGARVFGGTKRTDLLEELAYGMVKGDYAQAGGGQSEELLALAAGMNGAQQ